ncbi:GGDEF domain-containing protein [Qipengyuania sphaerica]|uniref:GGDEF domain-containing protein n=1 Tax=Qipengyuania sphaerica TaxID=2867243 RepID=UPI001C869B26|nr:GGDEF domain-containing protein [Qipengyuania sphaerica]MBX7539433.1 diguanylate cyclase [Qipengyuania sphaerica]
MRFYKATSFLFPRHYPARMFALCFGAVHIPLLTFLVFEAIRGQWHWGIFFALLVATVVGSVAAIAGIWGLLAPMEQATRSLRALRDGDLSQPIPVGGPDMAGQLLESVAHAARSTAERMEDLKGLATTDLLTGLANRRGFLEALGKRSTPAGTLAVLDGNNFKRVNDVHGHLEGDRVLRSMAERIAESIKGDDLAARWGGDEFVIFLADCDPVEANFRLEKLRQSMRRRPLSKIDGMPVSFAFGITELDADDVADLEAAIERADRALYRDKQGRELADA